MIDNQATVRGLEKEYSSRDPWVSTLVRTAGVTAAGIGCSIFATWEPRRPTRGWGIADNLTHNILTELT